MAHTPTGRPPGRPRKDVPVHVDAPEAQPRRAPRKHARPAPPGWLGPQPAEICNECYPDGWPFGASGLACGHGIWTRRPF